MSTPADRPTVVTQYIQDVLEKNRNELAINGNPADVFYGDQAKFPRTPAICVESAPFDRELDGIGGKGRTMNTHRVNIIAYVGLVGDSQVTRKACEELGERIMDVLHTMITPGGMTMEGLVAHGYVTSIQPGYSGRPDGMMHAVRVIWVGVSKTMIA